jgi:hypothetical protein
MIKKRHSAEEVATKLRQADAWSAQGRLHGDIAKALGVSLMTYHRWRKARPHVATASAAPALRVSQPAQRPYTSEAEYVEQLRVENARLRRVVTDLLLEKVQLEELLRESSMRRRKP